MDAGEHGASDIGALTVPRADHERVGGDAAIGDEAIAGGVPPGLDDRVRGT